VQKGVLIGKPEALAGRIMDLDNKDSSTSHDFPHLLRDFSEETTSEGPRAEGVAPTPTARANGNSKKIVITPAVTTLRMNKVKAVEATSTLKPKKSIWPGRFIG
jgi:hypothetical protein